MAEKDPIVPPRRLEEGERVLVHLRRRRLDNVLTGVFMAAVAAFVLITYLQWSRTYRLGAFGLVILLAIPIGVVLNTRVWLTDRRVLRSMVGVWKSFPLEGATPRATKAPLGDTVRFEDASGKPFLSVPAVDNAAEVLTAHAGLRDVPPAPPTLGETPS